MSEPYENPLLRRPCMTVGAMKKLLKGRNDDALLYVWDGQTPARFIPMVDTDEEVVPEAAPVLPVVALAFFFPLPDNQARVEI